MSCFSSRADFLNESCFLVSLWFFDLFALFRFIRAFDATGTAGRAHATLLFFPFFARISQVVGGMACRQLDGRELRYT